ILQPFHGPRVVLPEGKKIGTELILLSVFDLQSYVITLATTPQSQLKLSVMPTVAEQLRQAREAQKMTVHQIAEITKIRTDHIRALEEGSYDVFSAPVYIRGFVRTYAAIVKLDVPQIMAALDAELGQNKKFREPLPISGPPRG